MRRLLVLLAVLSVAAPAHAQVFLSAEPLPEFTIAPLFVSAGIAQDNAPPRLGVFWNVAPNPGSKQPHPAYLSLLLPFAITEPGTKAPGDAHLSRYVTQRGFTVAREGAVPITARNRADMGTGRAVQPIGAAPYVTFVRESAARGRSRAATLIRIPWSSQLSSLDWLVGLDMLAPDLTRSKPASWYENTFWGERHIASVSFGDLRHTALYPLYFELRDHVVPLGRDFSMLSINLGDANHLRIDQITPPTANRAPSESRPNTETISVPLASGEAITPQVVRVNYGYFAGGFEWRPIVISLLFLLLGNITGPVIVPLLKRLWRHVRARVDVGSDLARHRGVVLDAATVEKVRPGESTVEDVVRAFGPEYEELRQRHVAGAATRILRYRGERLVPQRSWRFGKLSRVTRWDLETHEVDVEIRDERVADVQARVRRARWEPALPQ